MTIDNELRVVVRKAEMREWAKSAEARTMIAESADSVHVAKHDKARVPCVPCVCGCACVLWDEVLHALDCGGLQ